MSQVRLLHLIMVAAVVMLTVKVADIMRDGNMFSELYGALPLSAKQAEEEEKKEEKKEKAGKEKDADKDKEKKEEKKTDKKEEKDKKDEKKEEKKEEKHGDKEEKKDEGKKEEEKAKAEPPTNAQPVRVTEKGKQAPPQFSQTELEILQRLSERRKELDEREKQIEQRVQVLATTEATLEKKLGEMKVLKGDLESLLATYNEKENVKIKSLVKIYENMKPKDAARIFDELDMPILLQVIDKMKQSKSAPVLALMNPGKAKDVTVQLANQKKLVQKTEASAAAPQAAPKKLQ